MGETCEQVGHGSYFGISRTKIFGGNTFSEGGSDPTSVPLYMTDPSSGCSYIYKGQGRWGLGHGWFHVHLGHGRFRYLPVVMTFTA